MSGHAADDTRRRELAMIHIAKQQLGMDEETYRAMLWSIARVSSAAELDYAGRNQVLEHLKKCGFKPRPAKRSPRHDHGDEQSKKIWALWLQLHSAGIVKDPSETALDHWVKRMTGVDALRWLTPRHKALLIEALKKWNDRPQS